MVIPLKILVNAEKTHVHRSAPMPGTMEHPDNGNSYGGGRVRSSCRCGSNVVAACIWGSTTSFPTVGDIDDKEWLKHLPKVPPRKMSFSEDDDGVFKLSV